MTHAHPPLQAPARPKPPRRARFVSTPPPASAQAFVYACVLLGLLLADGPVRHRSGQPSKLQGSVPAPRWGAGRSFGSLSAPALAGTSPRMRAAARRSAADGRCGGRVVAGRGAEVKATTGQPVGRVLSTRRAPPRNPLRLREAPARVSAGHVWATAGDRPGPLSAAPAGPARTFQPPGPRRGRAGGRERAGGAGGAPRPAEPRWGRRVRFRAARCSRRVCAATRRGESPGPGRQAGAGGTRAPAAGLAAGAATVPTPASGLPRAASVG